MLKMKRLSLNLRFKKLFSEAACWRSKDTTLAIISLIINSLHSGVWSAGTGFRLLSIHKSIFHTHIRRDSPLKLVNIIHCMDGNPYLSLKMMKNNKNANALLLYLHNLCSSQLYMLYLL